MRRALAIACVLAAVTLGCDRAAPPGGANVTTATHPAATSPATARASSPDAVPDLHDWVVSPPVVPEERDRPAPRIVSAAPNVTEICCALGLRDCLVGRTRYCTYPPGIEAVRSIGALNDLNVEVLLDLRPDLVLVSGPSRQITERLDRLGLAYASVPDFRLDDLFAAAEQIGSRTARARTAERLTDGIRADLEAVTAARRGQPARSVLVLTAPLADPPLQADAAGPGSFYDDLLRRAGHANAAAEAVRPFTAVSLEYVLRVDPDVVIELVPNPDQRPGGDADARRAWGRIGPLRAVAAGRVHILRGPQHFVLGPRIAHTYAALLELIASGEHE
jgi:iron complex transport system substrate-binding protein